MTGAANSTTTTSFTSAVDMALGVYTPLIAFGNGELAALSSGGTGSAARPYVLLNNEYGALDPEFAPMNDWQFPVFPGPAPRRHDGQRSRHATFVPDRLPVVGVARADLHRPAASVYKLPGTPDDQQPPDPVLGNEPRPGARRKNQWLVVGERRR